MNKTAVLLSEETNPAAVGTLEKMGFVPFFLPPFRALGEVVCSHPDMICYPAGNHLFVHADYQTEPGVLSLLETLKEDYGMQVHTTVQPLRMPKSEPTLFNLLPVGKYRIGKLKSVSKQVLWYEKQKQSVLLDVPQGYARCSALPIGGNSVLTSDRQIAQCCEKVGLSCLLIRPGFISIPKFEYGFIGGCGQFREGVLYLCGSLSSHPDAPVIRSFLEESHVSVCELWDGPLEDVGSFFFLEP